MRVTVTNAAAAAAEFAMQVYSDFDGFQLHDVVEVLGVMSVVPGLAALHDNQQQQQQGDAPAAGNAAAAGDGMDVDEGGFWEQDVAALPPTSQVSSKGACSCCLVCAMSCMCVGFGSRT
jgi:hypothetical protein